MRAPRFLIAAAHKSSGKTVVSTGLARALTARGLTVAAFKKGPDYIDPMWLGAATGGPCYNLDFNTQAPDEITAFFGSRVQASGVALVEANKGLFDGVSMDGSDSNAAIARLLRLPVILVIDTVGMTRGIAPLLQGYRAFDPQVNITGVILNKVGGPRHEKKLREAVETYTDLKVVGAVHRNAALEIGERHLGLTTPAETGELDALIARMGEIIGGSVDLDLLLELAGEAPDLPDPPSPAPLPEPDVTIAYARDRAFGFYYPDDLEAFAEAGARLVPFDAMKDAELPACDGLFIGGGFPEMFTRELAANTRLRADIRARIERGLPAYAECGGLMYLSRAIVGEGGAGEMVGVVPGEAVMHPSPEGKGLIRFIERADHPWPGPGGEIRAHEFHYARLKAIAGAPVYGRDMTRGHGVDGTHDGIVVHNALAGFCHLRATRADNWVARFVAFVRSHKAG
ncbi:cobyrinate a,c-diamide synthase [Sinisalibacter aestuarii]|uniref:Hydrogenobyrinate a,c-diamide synthase n=1 Tax=Sinisalibacter aestuarii TaxID=2949426 RepID=A0ABQ5LN57_9RHOB|nr:cobyrinate a,c-diamide synthase [Sinisalibacter aestuarii]GKY86393.1 cobyrinate a,c-diamide synthase [Sinisalibacter aestuarii]